MKIKTISLATVDYFEKIDKEVNEFIKDKDIIDIKVTQYLVPSVGNRITYTIIYND